MKNFGEKEAWAYAGTVHIFGVPPIISGTGKATDFKFSQCIQRVFPNKSVWKILEKKSVGVSSDCPIFSGTPYYLRNRESYGFQILHAHLWAQSEQKPIKNSRKVAVGVVMDSWKFSGRRYIGRIARSSLRYLSFLVIFLHVCRLRWIKMCVKQKGPAACRNKN